MIYKYKEKRGSRFACTARKFALGIIIPLAVGVAAASAITAQVVDVYDGDTLTVELPSGDRERVRLIGIDRPTSPTPTNT